MVFDEETIDQLFGNPAADKEKEDLLKNYFLKTDNLESIDSSNPFKIVIGYKGTGKSALIKYAYSSSNGGGLKILLDSDLLTPFYNKVENTFIGLIRLWKIELCKVIVKYLLDSYLYKISDKKKRMVMEWVETEGYRLPNFLWILIHKIENEIIEYICSDDEKERPLNGFYEDKKLNIYIDDLDRGWGATEIEKKSLSAFINAISDLTSKEMGLSFRIALRADVYLSIGVLDETQDKFSSNEIWVRWQNIDIYNILLKRISNFCKLSYSDEDIFELIPSKKSEILSMVFRSKFRTARYWKDKSTYQVLMSLIRRRPRDLVNICRKAAIFAKNNKHEVIEPNDILDCLHNYSDKCVKSIEIEFKKELPVVHDLILKMGPTRKEIDELGYLNVYKFTTDRLINKVSTQILPNLSIDLRPIEICNFLYKVGFITSRKVFTNNYIERYYFDDNPNLIDSHFDKGFNWEIHPAYRSILNLGQETNWEKTVQIEG